MPAEPNTIDYSWEECAETCKHMVGVMKAAGYTPRRILALAKGGLIPAALVHQAFPDAEFCVLRTKHYGPEGKTAEVELGTSISQLRDWDGYSTLIVDDICDTGDTFEALKEFMPDSHYAAMFMRNAGEDTEDTFHVDFVGYYVKSPGWVNFPWENMAE